MSDQHAEFRDRVQRLDRKHVQLAKGYSTRVDHDGLIVMTARAPKSRRPVLRVAMWIALAITVFKTLLIMELGSLSYEHRVDTLRHGTVPEQIGAFVMQQDPLSTWLATKLALALE